ACKALYSFSLTRPVYRQIANDLLRRSRALPLKGFQRITDLTTQQLIRAVNKATRYEYAWQRRGPRPIRVGPYTDINEHSNYMDVAKGGEPKDDRWFKIVSAPPDEEVDWLSPITSSYTLCATKTGKVVCWDVQTDQCLAEWSPGEKWELWKCRVEFEEKTVYFTMAKVLVPRSDDLRQMEFTLMRLRFSDGNAGVSADAPPEFEHVADFKTKGVVMNVFLLDPIARLLSAFIYSNDTNTICLYALLDWDKPEYIYIDTGIQYAFTFSDSKIETQSLPTSEVDKAAALKYVESKIEYHQRIVSYYNRYKNGFNVTCRLPPEILGLIFKEVKRISGTGISYLRRSRVDMGWIRTVSHTCSHWRRLSLHTPSLWVGIPMGSPKWAKEMVLRSKSAPLRIELNHSAVSVSESNFSWISDLLAGHLAHISTLSIKLDGEETTAQVFALLDQSDAPILERLEVTCWSDTDRSVDTRLPSRLLRTSRLQYLSLVSCVMDWGSHQNNFRNLQTLKIINSPAKLTGTQVLAMLASMPFLSILEIINSFAPDSWAPDAPLVLQPIKLDMLKEIQLDHRLDSCIFFLDHVAFSRNAHMVSFTMFPPVESISMKDKIAKIARRLDESIDGPLVGIEVESTCLRGWKSNDLPMKAPDFSDNATIYLELAHCDEDTCSEIAGFACRAFRMDQVLALSVSSTLNEDSWSIFTYLPNLREVQVRVQEAADCTFLNALKRGIDNGDGSNALSLQLPFPALKYLTLLGWELYHNVQSVAAGEHISLKESLVTCLTHRKNAGLVLYSIHFEDCLGVKEEDVERLRAIVVNVNTSWFESVDESDKLDDTYDMDSGAASD
ncbi:hypothetical protein H0H93_002309, partial [Arthromyces matolae]